MIHSLSLRNFKGIRRADVALERLTVIVGPNASGKTSVLQGLYYLGRVGMDLPSDIFQGRRDINLIYRYGAAGEEMELSGLGDGKGVRLRARAIAP